MPVNSSEEMVATAFGRFRLFTDVASPVTTTSSSLATSTCITTFKWDAAVTVCVLKPVALVVIDVPGETDRLKFPFTSAAIETVVFLTATVAEAMGAPFVSVTCPVTLIFCAESKTGRRSKLSQHVIVSNRFFIVLFWFSIKMLRDCFKQFCIANIKVYYVGCLAENT